MKPVEWSRDAAVRYAVKLLSYRDRSEKELRDKMSAKGIPFDLIDETIGLLKERGFIDDKRLAGQIARTARETKNMGRKGVREYLLRRGIDRDLADEASGCDDDYLDAARGLVEKRLAKCRTQPDNAALRRIWSALARRGFSPDIIHATLRDATGRHL